MDGLFQRDILKGLTGITYGITLNDPNLWFIDGWISLHVIFVKLFL